MIYLIEHPNAAFSGIAGGIDFHKGIGSTSSAEDAKRIATAIHGRFDAADVFKRSSAPMPPDVPTPEASAIGAGSTDGTPAAPAAEKPKARPGRKPK
jgi:hypothetical protein